jgi:diguanylate cyclase
VKQAAMPIDVGGVGDRSGHVRLYRALLDISRAPFDDLDATLERLMRIGCEALDVPRIGLWLFGPGRRSIRCEALWTLADGLHRPDLEASAEEVPAYFAALESELAIDACDALRDPRTREFTDGYLLPNNVGALLDAPVRRSGGAVGVLCLEHVGGPRQWTDPERMFSAALAMAVSQLLEHVQFREAVELRDRALFYDALTGLPNRALLIDRIAQRRQSATRSRLGVLALDIDRFADVQRGAGNGEADLLLCELAERLSALVTADRIGRVGPDEFAFLIESPAPGVEALSLAARIRSALAEPFQVGARCLSLSASIGIVADVSGYARAEDALRDAQIAAGEALRSGRGGQRFFDQGMQSDARERLELEVSIRSAAARGEFCFFLQPIVSADGARLIGAEALMRWHHPQRGLVPPLEFIRIAEEAGLLPDLHRPMVRSLLPTIAAWRRRPGFADFCLSINFDLRQLCDPGFAEHMAAVLQESGLPPAAVHAEITENVVLDAELSLGANLRELSAHGIGLVLDDFGTGFASITHLAALPLQGVKIDRSFVRRMGSDPRIAAIVRSLIELSGSLGLQVVAEGVETQAQRAQLTGWGCDALQGFLFGRPQPIDEFERTWLQPGGRAAGAT